ncbi:RNA pseudouridylate synthase domain-containing protein 4, partial [Trichoplax sp. H2]
MANIRVFWAQFYRTLSSASRVPVVTADTLLVNSYNVIAINKPYGIASHDNPGIGYNCHSIYRELNLDDDSQPVYPSHVLDRNCTGILIGSKDKEVSERIQKSFINGKIYQRYWAITVGIPKAIKGTIDIPIVEDKTLKRVKLKLQDEGASKQEIAYKYGGRVRLASTNYKVLSKSEIGCALIEFETKTYYKKQIRVHAADALGCPVLGDHQYSSKKIGRNQGVIAINLLALFFRPHDLLTIM